MRLWGICLWNVCLLLGVSAMAHSGRSQGADIVRAYIGTYTDKGSEGIYVLELDRDKGTVTEARLAAKQSSASFLNIHHTLERIL